MAQQGLSQADKRRDMNLKDQFGRKWLAAIEKESFEPAGHITPAGWTDPIRTPSQYVRIPRDEYGNPQVGQCRVEFERWAKDQDQATKEWKIRLWNIGREQQKNAFDPKTAERDEYLLHLAGPKPWPTPALIREAAEGKTKRAKQLLGTAEMERDVRMLLGYVELEDLEAIANEQFPQAEEIDKELKGKSQEGRPPFNTGNFKEFIAACLERKISMKDGAKLWKEFQGALTEVEVE